MSPQLLSCFYVETELADGSSEFCPVSDLEREYDREEMVEGYLWRLSASGYMDCTEWSLADSPCAAVRDALGLYGDGMDESDLLGLGTWLEGFEEFWEGYLLGLVFTGNDETLTDPELPDDEREDNPEPLVSNPGGDIRDVISPDEVSAWLSTDQRVELLSDCLSFFTDALEYFGSDPDFEHAGSDFHLTRNGHGAGFWDGDWEHGAKLTELAKPYGDDYQVHN